MATTLEKVKRMTLFEIADAKARNANLPKRNYISPELEARSEREERWKLFDAAPLAELRREREYRNSTLVKIEPQEGNPIITLKTNMQKIRI